jgi:hypothetical protein
MSRDDTDLSMVDESLLRAFTTSSQVVSQSVVISLFHNFLFQQNYQTTSSAFTPLSLRNLLSSESSSLDSLSPAQVRKLKDNTRKAKDQVNLFKQWYTNLTGNPPDETLAVNSLASILDAKYESRTFSSMTDSDYVKLNPGELGMIMINPTALENSVQEDDIPPEFLTTLAIYRRNVSRSKEMGSRLIIGHFLAYAVEIAKKKFGLERLCVHSEVEVEATVIPEIHCSVHGLLDYVTAAAAGKLPMGTFGNRVATDLYRANHGKR